MLHNQSKFIAWLLWHWLTQFGLTVVELNHWRVHWTETKTVSDGHL